MRAIQKDKDTLFERELQLTPLEHVPVLIAKNGEQQLPVKFRLGGRPIDVEERRGLSARSVFEQVAPPRVGVRADAHVVRHEVHDMPHAVLGNRRGKSAVGLAATHFGIDFVVVADVVSVRAARLGCEVR